MKILFQRGYWDKLTLLIVEEIHSTVIATVDDNGLPVTCAIDIMDFDENGLYFLTAKEKGFYDRLKNRTSYCGINVCPYGIDNEAAVRKMIAEQHNMKIPSNLIPYCPVCGAPMTMNLRCDNSFVQDEGWYQANTRYEDFVRRHKNSKLLLFELGVGNNTPVIIKYSFWKMTIQNPNAVYSCVNLSDAYAPTEIKRQSVCLDGDIGAILKKVS